MFKLEQIGENTINKIAEMALARQIKQAEKVSVKVKTDPEKLAKGLLESITISGSGLMLNSYLRVQEMEIKLNQIVVNPFKALMGNIQLIQPSLGTIHVVLKEKDIEQSLRDRIWHETSEANRSLSNQTLQISIQQVLCKISEQGQIIITTQIHEQSTGEIKEVLLKAIPTIELNNEIALKEIQQTENSLTTLVNEIILKEIIQVLNFNSFYINGLDWKIQQLTFKTGQFIVQGIAIMSRFPGA
ncbi:DUF2993 domain-containing protein [Aphanothece hegewaldii CCALA 016]|uniref:DUF2993 domain-containing protein n=1 Tax=Aphanothece hegewaldii CCALA 016 TaxID=2107694 RepID=A0A2T1LUS5_9CHRO|nr:DUF2993 domain-containing protein [Aphanothece hegewaldii]PSF35382.1 DUF2993 domain-containing protein [Aphanothece hegewaldii CCALA 016]